MTISSDPKNTDHTNINWTKITRKQKWVEKQFMDIWSVKQVKSHTRKLRHGLEKEIIRKETESLLIAAQKNTMKTKYVKERIDKTQQNSMWISSGDRNETISHIISECSLLAQKEYKIRHDCVGKCSTGNCARSLNLKIWTNGISIIQNPW